MVQTRNSVYGIIVFVLLVGSVLGCDMQRDLNNDVILDVDNTQINHDAYCELDGDCVIQRTDNCCERKPVNKEYYIAEGKICAQVCDELNVVCKDNTCVFERDINGTGAIGS